MADVAGILRRHSDLACHRAATLGSPLIDYPMQAEGHFSISTDPALLDIGLIHKFLSESYWARAIPRDLVEKSIRHSLCFGAYKEDQQVGFARVITDYATFGYVADVFVLPEHRGQGISKKLMHAIVEHPDLQILRRWMLATRDAHGLYAPFGFAPVPNPKDFMTIHKPSMYQTPA